MMVIRENERVRLMSRGGHDYAKRYPWIVEAARANRHKHFAIDGEVVLLGVDGISDFDGLHSGKHNDEAQVLHLRHVEPRRRRSAPAAA